MANLTNCRQDHPDARGARQDASWLAEANGDHRNDGPSQVRGNSARSLAFESAASGSTAFTDAMEALDPATDPEAATPDLDSEAAALAEDAPQGEGRVAGLALSTQTSLARRRALEWEQRMKVTAILILRGRAQVLLRPA